MRNSYPDLRSGFQFGSRPTLNTKFRRNPTSSLWEILLTNKQTNRQTDTRMWLQYPAFRGIINRQTKNFDHTEIRTLDRRVFSTMLLPTELEGRTHLINLIRLLLSDYFYQINKKVWPHRGSNSQPSRF